MNTTKKWEIIITVVVIIVAVVLVGVRLWVINYASHGSADGSLISVPILSEEVKLDILHKLNKDSRNLSIEEKQKILNALVHARK